MVQVEKEEGRRPRDDYIYLLLSTMILVLAVLPVVAALVGLAVRVFLWAAGLRSLY